MKPSVLVGALQCGCKHVNSDNGMDLWPCGELVLLSLGLKTRTLRSNVIALKPAV